LLERIAEIRTGTTGVLRELQAIELIYEKTLFPELAYMFKHALTQDVAYGSLLTQRRRELHQRIGTAIEELYADRLAEHYAVLGYHFARGEESPRAADYFEQAAEHAAAAFAIHEAIALNDQALVALDRCGNDAAVTAKRADLHARKAGLYMVQSDFERAHADGERAVELAVELSDQAREGAALAGMGLVSFFAHQFDRSVEESQRAIDVGLSIGSDGTVAAGQCWIAWVEAVTGRLEDARATFTEARRKATDSRSLLHQTISSAILSQIGNWQGDFRTSEPLGRQALQLARESNLPLAHLISLFTIGLPLTGKGRYDEALAIFAEGLTLANKVGDEFFRNRMLNCTGWVYAECGEIERAIICNREGLGQSRERGDPEVTANCELNLGDAARAQDDLPLALEYLNSVYGLARKPTTSDFMKWRYSQHLFAGLGEAWLASDDPTRADDFCNQCLDLATRTDSKKYLVRGWRLKGEIAMARLQWEEAEEALRKALSLAKWVGNPTQLWKTQMALGELYRDTRRAEQGRASFAAASKVIDGIGQNLQTPELKEGFERSPFFRAVYERIAIA